MLKYDWKIIGHESQLSRLELEIEKGNLSHAYLFSGPKQVGKFTIAKQLASRLQCAHQFCQKCLDCLAMQNESHPDLILMKDQGESIKIDQVRELSRQVSMTHQGKYRLVLIENVNRMPTEAQNAFLKTLEEPTPNTIFILTTDQLNRVLPTIQSRVRHYYFSTVSSSVLAEALKQEKKESLDHSEIIRLSQGFPGLMIDLIEDKNFLMTQREIYVKINSFLRKNDINQKFLYIESIDKEPLEIAFFLDSFGRYIRQLIRDEQQLGSHELGHRFTLKELVNLFDILEKTRYFIERNINKKLALENLLLATEK